MCGCKGHRALKAVVTQDAQAREHLFPVGLLRPGPPGFGDRARLVLRLVALFGRVGRGRRLREPGQGRVADEVADAVDDEGDRCAHDLDEDAREARSGDHADRGTALHPRVGPLQLAAWQQPGEVGGHGAVEQQAERSDEEDDEVQHGHAQQVEPEQRRDGEHQHTARQVRHQHDAPAFVPVGPDTGRQSQQQHGRGLRRLQDAHLPRCGREGRHRDDAHGHEGDLGAGERDGLSGPQAQEAGSLEGGLLRLLRRLARGNRVWLLPLFGYQVV